MKIKVDIKGLDSNLARIIKATEQSTTKSMKDCMQDLNRVASETAPLDKGDLEMSGTDDVKKTGTGIQGSVGYEVWNTKGKKDFNYAIWIHEETYNLGDKSLAKAGGKGLSGKSYKVDRKYLERPFYGEAPTYRGIIESNLKKDLGG
ncbi:hypothetical protein ABEX38_29880 [Priestia megaterium]